MNRPRRRLGGWKRTFNVCTLNECTDEILSPRLLAHSRPCYIWVGVFRD